MENEIYSLIEEYTTLSKGVLNFDKLALYISTFHSTSIEGSTLTENEVIDLLTLNKTAPKKPFEHHLMVSDYYNAMNFVLSNASEKKEITESFVKNIGHLVKKNTGSEVNTMIGMYDTSKGDYRLGGVFAGKRQFPDYKKVPKLVNELIQSTNFQLKKAVSIEEQLKLSFKFHF
jgi:Fic family protein